MKSNQVGLTKSYIVEVAAELFAKNGYRATSLNDVATILNVSKPALYYHFKNKHEILKSIFDEIMQIYLLNAKNVYDRGNLTSDKKLTQLIESHAMIVMNYKNLSTIFFTEKNELEKLALDELNIKIGQYEQYFKTVINQGIDEKVIRLIPTKLFVMGIFGMTNWIYYWYEEDGTLSKEQIAKLYSSLLQNGYLLR
jgi:AcrR family transcriptional regulator